MPAFAVSARHGRLDGHGLEGFYRAGRRLVGRLRLRVGGVEPLPVQGRRAGADRVRFVGTVRTGAEPGPDPAVVVEQVRHAAGVERITLHSSATRALKLTLEAELGTDLAELSAVAAGRERREVPASVHESGLRWRPLPAPADPGGQPDAGPEGRGREEGRSPDSWTLAGTSRRSRPAATALSSARSVPSSASSVSFSARVALLCSVIRSTPAACRTCSTTTAGSGPGSAPVRTVPTKRTRSAPARRPCTGSGSTPPTRSRSRPTSRRPAR
ncbi:hypothetical protein GCM10009802_68080 [Streptomyces synnematoformans]|uniref:Putative glycogen debranching enzyme N-terminal domain-containing protein n=1 Tax=Streptomyces synnematoformans TaxID=415721 RepID=A0ABN2AHE5_9ACTN